MGRPIIRMELGSRLFCALLAGLLFTLLRVDAQAELLPTEPVVQMAKDYVYITAGQNSVDIQIQLLGTSTSTVDVTCQIIAQGSSSIEQQQQQQPQFTVSWLPGSSGARSVTLPPTNKLFPNDSSQRSLQVVLIAATNAILQDQRLTTTVSLDAQTNLPEFTYTANGAAYPGSQPQISVKLSSGSLSEPIALGYKLKVLTPVKKQFLSQRAMSGFLQFGPESAEQSISVPIVWSVIPPEAQYRLGVVLDTFAQGRISNPSDDIALHIFGVEDGTCPPGSALQRSSRNGKPSTLTSGWWQDSLYSPSSSESSQSNEEIDQQLILVAAGAPVRLTKRVRRAGASDQELDYGGMVPHNVTSAVLCMKQQSEQPGRNVAGVEGIPPVASSNAKKTCCQVLAKEGTGCSPSDYEAWDMELEFGQNRFNVTAAPSISQFSVPAPAAEPSNSGENQQDLDSTTTTRSTVETQNAEAEQDEGYPLLYSLSVVRLANESQVELQSLTVKDLNGQNITLCGTPASGGAGSNDPAFTPESLSVMWAKSTQSVGAPAEISRLVTPKPCKLGVAMTVNVSAASDIVSLAPQLLYPTIEGVRVEVSGQVLSRGGNVSADQLEDTAPNAHSTRGPNSTFLPTAFIMGLQYGVRVDVEVVVVAEDGVTSARYPVSLFRDPASQSDDNGIISEEESGDGLEESEGSEGKRMNVSSVTYIAPPTEAQMREKGWPESPALNERCEVCPAGWASFEVNAEQCQMCPPGTFSPEPQSQSCEPCQPGSYAFSWGSTHCKHCIEGTYAVDSGSDLCRICPANMTTLEDGQTACNVTVAPATDLSERYAVVVHFSLYLTGTDPEAIVLKAGVNAPAESIVESLLRVDTAAAFNISVQDVHVMGISQVSRRVLRANVSATLGVDLPPDATEEDIAAAMEVQRLSADKPIELLSQDPDAFFGRTTRTLEVGVQSFDAATMESRPDLDSGISKWALLVPGVLGIVGGSVLVTMGLWRSRSCLSNRQRVLSWVGTLKVTPNQYRYSRQV